MDIILASHNQHKAAEIKEIFRGFPLTLVTLDRYPEIGEIEETGKTLEENALIKARTVHYITGLPTISDDTGLEVDALKGAPGVFSARYAGEHATYEENVKKLLKEMKNVDEVRRTARFRTVIAFVDGEIELISEGIISGWITLEGKGSSGFGYDPVFFVPELNCTFAELSAYEKNKISHRRHALQNLYKQLSAHWSNQKYTGV